MSWMGWVVIVILSVNMLFFGFLGIIAICDAFAWRKEHKKREKKK